MMTMDVVDMLIYYYNLSTPVTLSRSTTLSEFQKYMEGKLPRVGENGVSYYLIADVEDFFDRVGAEFHY